MRLLQADRRAFGRAAVVRGGAGERRPPTRRRRKPRPGCRSPLRRRRRNRGPKGEPGPWPRVAQSASTQRQARLGRRGLRGPQVPIPTTWTREERCPSSGACDCVRSEVGLAATRPPSLRSRWTRSTNSGHLRATSAAALRAWTGHSMSNLGRWCAHPWRVVIRGAEPRHRSRPARPAARSRRLVAPSCRPTHLQVRCRFGRPAAGQHRSWSWGSRGSQCSEHSWGSGGSPRPGERQQASLRQPLSP